MNKIKTPFDNFKFEFEETPEYISLEVYDTIFNFCIFRQVLYTKQTKYTKEDLVKLMITELYKRIEFSKAARYGKIVVSEWDKDRKEWFIVDEEGNKQYESSFIPNENK